ncbi:MAG TPA: ABC transporter ATP-binding protein [Bryobacteraceae bacterium]|nr:ABC transporter ATP-binding protein [Bryobacteraceae bacterium]
MTHVRIGKKVAPVFSLDVDFEIIGVTALYGPAGSGKSLILESVAGFSRPDSGRILREDVLLFDAQAGVHVPPRGRAAGYLPAQDALFPHLTVRQNLAFGTKGRRLERHRRIAEFLERYGLSEAAARRPAELDTAQRTRAAVARALIASPKLLLLDEPDMPEALFRQMRAEFAGPVLLATRDLDRCTTLADQVLVLEAGRILRRGSPRDVLDEPESVEVARLLGIPNLFECTIAGLDPGRNSSRLEAASFQVTGPYLPGHFRGDRVWVAIRPERVRVANAGAAGSNLIPVKLVRVSHRAAFVRLEFSGGVFADLSPEEYVRQKDNREWQAELPADALRVL